ncbi:translesion error-prone DNA polymerase V autoproteolytic subunit [Cronobacter malonaticus]|uniref:translesion error-prone DNA polymerase V autoproteolytic subunit n=1 Tax=Cronobacter malonaticus TaxID=413503 RepID=UPI00051941B4|nr:translesion error-prone DNA polymerase V autoproteolytic subunit [Cronobacter malonaticus]EGT4370217.1 translesion error-prone DNA polymerase V autoproteolytic subunit [Cronobacter malonaticus]ELY6231038.1 translesion error-prone DNA polymerase V autoproteolytic subunit [Cronobacter malonaticus]MDI6468188.1 translesion error-prone DNA polymerase V autoproteolytic subunit [Cronobacter malonaticus]MDK1176913.1 translesion error-prone DNA polymerase V autoproteolytic subunit [Cronobacter malona
MLMMRLLPQPDAEGLPLFLETVACGFPSPAQDYVEKRVSLDAHCIVHPNATYFLRAAGESMNGAGIEDGDLLVVDSALKPQEGDIVVAALEGEFTVKTLRLHPVAQLVPMNPAFAPIPLGGDAEVVIFGVVTWVLKKRR